MSGKGLTHIGEDGRARMVDVSGKDATRREARAEAKLFASAETLALVREGKAKKGDVIGVAELAGIMGAKKTADLIPLCHPLPLSSLKVSIELADDHLRVECLAVTTGQTGVEMEALTGASVAALTLYDMLKAADKAMRIDGIRLLEKTGGRSGHYRAEE
ncbi:MAG: cyclic pyranopterin monophosphate synthase MoaC [Hyphomonas sp.]